jgi:hypothetical protein
VRPGEIFQVLPHRLLILQVMMLLHQTIQQRFVTRSPHMLQLDGPEFLRAPTIGVVSISIGAEAARRTKGLRVKRMGGNSISPTRWSMSNKPRHTIAPTNPRRAKGVRRNAGRISSGNAAMKKKGGPWVT